MSDAFNKHLTNQSLDRAALNSLLAGILPG